MLVGIIPNPYTERRCGNGKPKEKYTDEVLRYGRRKAADRREDEAASHKAVWGIYVDAPDKSSGKRRQHIHIQYDGLGFIPLNELFSHWNTQ